MILFVATSTDAPKNFWLPQDLFRSASFAGSWLQLHVLEEAIWPAWAAWACQLALLTSSWKQMSDLSQWQIPKNISTMLLAPPLSWIQSKCSFLFAPTFYNNYRCYRLTGGSSNHPFRLRFFLHRPADALFRGALGDSLELQAIAPPQWSVQARR